MIGPFIVSEDADITAIKEHFIALSSWGERMYLFLIVPSRDPDYSHRDEGEIKYIFAGNALSCGEGLNKNPIYSSVTLLGRADDGEWMTPSDVADRRMMNIHIADRLRDLGN